MSVTVIRQNYEDLMFPCLNLYVEARHPYVFMGFSADADKEGYFTIIHFEEETLSILREVLLQNRKDGISIQAVRLKDRKDDLFLFNIGAFIKPDRLVELFPLIKEDEVILNSKVVRFILSVGFGLGIGEPKIKELENNFKENSRLTIALASVPQEVQKKTQLGLYVLEPDEYKQEGSTFIIREIENM
jgi:hypothetical protein